MPPIKTLQFMEITNVAGAATVNDDKDHGGKYAKAQWSVNAKVEGEEIPNIRVQCTFRDEKRFNPEGKTYPPNQVAYVGWRGQVEKIDFGKFVVYEMDPWNNATGGEGKLNQPNIGSGWVDPRDAGQAATAAPGGGAAPAPAAGPRSTTASEATIERFAWAYLGDVAHARLGAKALAAAGFKAGDMTFGVEEAGASGARMSIACEHAGVPSLSPSDVDRVVAKAAEIMRTGGAVAEVAEVITGGIAENQDDYANDFPDAAPEPTPPEPTPVEEDVLPF
jgi:hypothetical protein